MPGFPSDRIRNRRWQPAEAGNTERIVRVCGDGPANVRTVAIRIVGDIIILDPIPAMEIIDKAVEIVVDSRFAVLFGHVYP